MSKLVYLAGPITGLSYKSATSWRQYASEWLLHHGIIGLSPMRGKAYLQGLGPISGHGQALSDPAGVLTRGRALSDPAGILTRDHWDCQRADVILANLASATAVSIGTVMEIAWAHAYRKPLVLVLSDNNPHDHMMVRQAAGFVVDTLDEGLHMIAAIFQGDL